MFSWLFPATCPVPPDRKAWLEQGLNWLYREFGEERMLSRPFILPTQKCFPDPYDPADSEAVAKLFARVCHYMEVDRHRVRMRIFDDGREDRPGMMHVGRSEGAAGLYGRSGAGQETIQIARSQLSDPMAMVGTMAHELAHVHLLGDGRLADDNPDHEHLTDLLTVVYGLGVFTANSVIRESNWQSGNVSGWSVGKQGYLTGPEYGYAFALIAWARGEAKPEWLGHLRLDVRSACKRGIRFLTKTGDTRFRHRPAPNDETAFERSVSSKSSSEDHSDDDDVPWSKPSSTADDADDGEASDRLPWEK